MLSFDPYKLVCTEMRVKRISTSGVLVYEVEEDGVVRERQASTNSVFLKNFKYKTNNRLRYHNAKNAIVLFYGDEPIDIEFEPSRYIMSLFSDTPKDYVFRIEQGVKTIHKNASYFSPVDGVNEWYIDGENIFTINSTFRARKNKENKADGPEPRIPIKVISASGFRISDIAKGNILLVDENIGKVVSFHSNVAYEDYLAKSDGVNNSPTKNPLSDEEYKEKSKKEKFAWLNSIFKRNSFRLLSCSVPQVNREIISPAFPPSTINSEFDMELLNQRDYVNLYWYVQAALKIGGMYGHQKNMFLQIRKTMVDLKVSNFAKIPTKQQKSIPVAVEFKAAVLWLLSFFDREESIVNQVKLRKLLTLLVPLNNPTGRINKLEVKISSEKVKSNDKRLSGVRLEPMDVNKYREAFRRKIAAEEQKLEIA